MVGQESSKNQPYWVLLEFTFHLAKNVQSDQNPYIGSSSQATYLLKAKGKASCGYAFELKNPKNRKKKKTILKCIILQN